MLKCPSDHINLPTSPLINCGIRSLQDKKCNPQLQLDGAWWHVRYDQLIVQ